MGREGKEASAVSTDSQIPNRSCFILLGVQEPVRNLRFGLVCP